MTENEISYRNTDLIPTVVNIFGRTFVTQQLFYAQAVVSVLVQFVYRAPAPRLQAIESRTPSLSEYPTQSDGADSHFPPKLPVVRNADVVFRLANGPGQRQTALAVSDAE